MRFFEASVRDSSRKLRLPHMKSSAFFEEFGVTDWSVPREAISPGRYSLSATRSLRLVSIAR